MKMRIAETSDAPLIHDLMIRAFMEYKDEVPPSSALEETVETVLNALEDGEQAIISYIGDEPVGMVRFRLKNHAIYFYRLAVIPERQGQGIAKEILMSLEDYAKRNGKFKVLCKVRKTIPKNIELYQTIGYRIYDEEVLCKPNGIHIKVVSMKKRLVADA